MRVLLRTEALLLSAVLPPGRVQHSVVVDFNSVSPSKYRDAHAHALLIVD